MQAAETPIASTQRLLLVTAFNIFGWTGACQRTDYKAMRPMDYETFDFESAELGFSFLTEFVSHFYLATIFTVILGTMITMRAFVSRVRTVLCFT